MKDLYKMGGLVGIIAVLAIVAMAAIMQPMSVAPGYTTTQGGVNDVPATISINVLEPTLQVDALDMAAKGTVVATTKFMYRTVNTPSGIPTAWADDDTSSTVADVGIGDRLEIVVGIQKADDDAEPYGDVFFFDVPEKGGDIPLTFWVWQDAEAGDITAQYKWANSNWDTTKTGSIVSGNYVLTAAFTAPPDEAWGNYWCGEDSNTVTFKMPTNNVTDVDGMALWVEKADGTTKTFSITELSLPMGKASTYSPTDYDAYAFNFPVMSDGETGYIKVNVKASDTYAINTSVAAITVFLDDSNHYFNDDYNDIRCGIEDEDRAEVGAIAADQLTPLITP